MLIARGNPILQVTHAKGGKYKYNGHTIYLPHDVTSIIMLKSFHLCHGLRMIDVKMRLLQCMLFSLMSNLSMCLVPTKNDAEILLWVFNDVKLCEMMMSMSAWLISIICKVILSLERERENLKTMWIQRGIVRRYNHGSLVKRVDTGMWRLFEHENVV